MYLDLEILSLLRRIPVKISVVWALGVSSNRQSMQFVNQKQQVLKKLVNFDLYAFIVFLQSMKTASIRSACDSMTAIRTHPRSLNYKIYQLNRSILGYFCGEAKEGFHLNWGAVFFFIDVDCVMDFSQFFCFAIFGQPAVSVYEPTLSSLNERGWGFQIWWSWNRIRVFSRNNILHIHLLYKISNWLWRMRLVGVSFSDAPQKAT